MAVYFDSAYIYITSVTDLTARLSKIRQVINALLDLQISAALNENIAEYWLDDGQTKIKMNYRSSEDIAKAITDLQRIEQTYLNQLNGRVSRLVDGKNFTGNRIP
jgi:peptidyl-tRNA hydrolase